MLIKRNRWALGMNRGIDTLAENTIAIASDLQQLKEETRLAFTAIAKRFEVDLDNSLSNSDV